MKLRADQADAVQAVGDAYRAGYHRVILMAATGYGKTHVACALMALALLLGQRVIFLAPRRELVWQCSERLDSMGLVYGKVHGVYMADADAREIMEAYMSLPIVVASKDTLISRRGRRSAFPQADMVLVDEAHLSTSQSWLKLLNHYADEGAFVLGLTATPARTSGKGLGELYELIVETPDVGELMAMGILSSARYFAPSKILPDVSKVPIYRGDYAERKLSEAVNKPLYIGDVLMHWQRLAADRQTIIFCVDVAHAKAVAQEFKSHGINTAQIDAKTPLDERKQIMADFRSGDIRVISNVDIFTYGIDVPAVSCIVLLRPTKSIVRHMQSIGRGLRVSPGKDFCLVLDHSGTVLTLGRAEDQRIWSLTEGGKTLPPKTSRVTEIQNVVCSRCRFIYPPARQCPNCGHAYDSKPKGVVWQDGVLVELKPKPKRQTIKTGQLIAELKGAAVQRGLTGKAANHFVIRHFKIKARGRDLPPGWYDIAPLQPSPRVRGFVYGVEKNTRKRKESA